MRHVTSATPVVLGGALVIPAGLLRRLRGESPAEYGSAFSADPAARARIEKLAMDAVRHAEEARGCRVVDVSAQKCGWDITSYPPAVDGKSAGSPPHRSQRPRERRGHRHRHQERNALRLNQADKFHLAIVLVGEDDAVDGPHYCATRSRKNPAGACPRSTTTSKRCSNAPKEFNR